MAVTKVHMRLPKITDGETIHFLRAVREGCLEATSVLRQTQGEESAPCAKSVGWENWLERWDE